MDSASSQDSFKKARAAKLSIWLSAASAQKQGLIKAWSSQALHPSASLPVCSNSSALQVPILTVFRLLCPGHKGLADLAPRWNLLLTKVGKTIKVQAWCDYSGLTWETTVKIAFDVYLRILNVKRMSRLGQGISTLQELGLRQPLQFLRTTEQKW